MKKITSEFNIDVLVVDDYLINLELTKHMLQMMKCRVDTAENGVEALKKVKDKKYDIVFMDIQMPDMDGIQTTSEIRKITENNGHIPVVALTANAIEGDREKYLDSGLDDYISKPITGEGLEEILLRQLPADKVLHR
ncbi:MAG: Signal transduction histidine-protein kinase BarA [Chlamydiae bacterium]|nr:Signal transduction histidine-protein kinase BarA [Chlamydiota bacterium]